MIHPSHKFVSPEEYLALEQASRDKHEYWHGEMYMIAGTSRRHNLIAGNIYLALRQKADRSCTVFMADVRLRIDKDNAYTYPDVMVICGQVQTDPRQQDTVMNPKVIVEVLSDSTQEYDRNEKFKMYRNIPSLEHYLMIEQDQPYIESYRREGRFWVLETLEGLESVLKLRSINLDVSFSEIYAQIDWTQQ
jgi:Uma2 family endonuclease